MKTVTVEEFRAHVDRYLIEAEREDVVLTRGDKPCVLLQPIPSRRAAKPTRLFHRLIQERRTEKPIPRAEAKASLGMRLKFMPSTCTTVPVVP